MMVESGGLIAQSLPLHLSTDSVDAGRAAYLQEQQAQPLAHVRQRQGWCPLLPPVGLPDQTPHREQGQGHMVVPTLPGAHLVLVHAHFTLAALEAGFNAGARLDHPRQLFQRRFLERPFGPTGRREIIMVAMPGVLIGGIVRGAGFQGTVVCTRTPGAHQPLLGSQALARDPCLYPAHDHLDVYRPFLTVSHREAPPGCRIKALQNGSCDSTPFWLPAQQKWSNQVVEPLLSCGFLQSHTSEVTI